MNTKLSPPDGFTSWLAYAVALVEQAERADASEDQAATMAGEIERLHAELAAGKYCEGGCRYCSNGGVLLLERAEKADGEIERLQTLCKSLVGEETLHQDGQYETEMDKLLLLLNCRAGKLLLKGKPFIVVANDEPYFTSVYLVIREAEKVKGRWTDECEKAFQEATHYDHEGEFPDATPELRAVWMEQRTLNEQADAIERLQGDYQTALDAACDEIKCRQAAEAIVVQLRRERNLLLALHAQPERATWGRQKPEEQYGYFIDDWWTGEREFSEAISAFVKREAAEAEGDDDGRTRLTTVAKLRKGEWSYSGLVRILGDELPITMALGLLEILVRRMAKERFFAKPVEGLAAVVGRMAAEAVEAEGDDDER